MVEGSESHDDWHRRECVRRLHQNRERGLAGGPVPTVQEVRRRERGPVSDWLQPQQTPRESKQAHGQPPRWNTMLLIAGGVALGGAALALKLDSYAAKGRLAHQQLATGASQ